VKGKKLAYEMMTPEWIVAYKIEVDGESGLEGIGFACWRRGWWVVVCWIGEEVEVLVRRRGAARHGGVERGNDNMAILAMLKVDLERMSDDGLF
jgi:hypothetical protein